MPASFTDLLYHVVFSTKQRLPLITKPLREPLYRYMGGILRSKGGTVLEAGGIADHVHLLVRLHPTLSIADAVRLVKTNSSRWLNEPPRLDGGFRWQAGYGAFSIGASMVNDVARYIRDQEAHHEERSFEVEMRLFSAKHGVEIDEKSFWS